MKKTFTCVLITICLNQFVYATSVDPILCRRQILASALGQRIQDMTIESLLAHQFAIARLQKSNDPSFEYIVSTESESRIDKTTVGIDYGVSIVEIKGCKVKVTMLAD